MNRGGPGAFASFVDPREPERRITYEKNGGSFGLIYNRDGSVNLAGALNGAGCPVASSKQLSTNEESYTCVDPGTALETRGVIIVRPSYGGWIRVQATLPAALDHTVSDILDRVH